ncbi:MAG: glycosyl hydrolase 108 family protein, partial [Acidobacteriaceae bacterium]
MTEKNWPQIAIWIRQSEGGFVNDPRDPGGATNFGVTLRVLQAWRHRATSVADVRDLSSAEANDILKAQYFDAVHGAQLPSGLDYAV